jgi:hypothetical protein
MKTSFKSKYTLMKALDKLPHGTEWKLKRITVEGNLLMNGQPDCEELKLWLRDPVNCIRELFGNPEFNGTVSYAPEQVFVDEEGKTRRFDEMWTGNWWWEMQVSASMWHVNLLLTLHSKPIHTGKATRRGGGCSGHPSFRQNFIVTISW